MVFDENLLNYTDCMIYFTLNTDASEKHLGSVVSQNSKPIELLYIRVRKTRIKTLRPASNLSE